MVQLLEGPPKVTWWCYFPSYFWVGNQDAVQQTQAGGSGWMKRIFWVQKIMLCCCSCCLLSHIHCLGVGWRVLKGPMSTTIYLLRFHWWYPYHWLRSTDVHLCGIVSGVLSMLTQFLKLIATGWMVFCECNTTTYVSAQREVIDTSNVWIVAREVMYRLYRYTHYTDEHYVAPGEAKNPAMFPCTVPRDTDYTIAYQEIRDSCSTIAGERCIFQNGGTSLIYS